MTAVMRHLTDPANKVYFFDMEGAIYEVGRPLARSHPTVHQAGSGLARKGVATRPQRRVVIANNGESGSASMYKHLLVGGPAEGDEAGRLGPNGDGDRWEIVRRAQFTDVTGP